MNISQKLRVLFLYLFRVSDEGIRLCKSRAGRVSRIPSDKTLFRRWSARSPSRSTVANIRGERYDTILIKILPLAFRHTIISLYRVINRPRKRIRECLNNQAKCTLYGMHLKRSKSRTCVHIFLQTIICIIAERRCLYRYIKA